jgi:PIN domain nuclease of toxin-antitoxin system
VIALDAYALIAFLADEPAREEVEDVLDEPCVMTTLNLAESLDVLGRVYGIDGGELRQLVGPLVGDAFTVEAPPEPDAWSAARIRSLHYLPTTCELSLADCFLVAAAARLDARVATADPAVAAVARAESLELVPLPDTSGRRP